MTFDAGDVIDQCGVVFFQAEDGIRDLVRSRGLGDVYKRQAKGRLEAYDLEEQRMDVIVEGITDFEISHDGKTLIYQAGSRLRVLKAGEKPDANSGAASRRSGWLDLDRICLLYTSPSPRDRTRYRMPSSA